MVGGDHDVPKLTLRSGLLRTLGLDLVGPLLVFQVCRRAGVAEVWSFRADKAAEAVADGAMPPRRYTVLHPEARLSDEETDQLIAALDAMNASRSDNSGPGGGDEDNSGRGGGATAEPPRGRQALNGHEDLRHLRSLHGGAEVTA